VVVAAPLAGLLAYSRFRGGKLGIPMIYVTHDISEALAFADVIIPIVSGKIDRSWIERPRNDQEGEEQALHPKAARKHRLSLVY
jgi:ABC-type sugar transport system ATPase subunit